MSPGYDTKQSDGEAQSNVGALESTEYPFIAIAPRSSLDWNGSTWYDEMELNYVLVLNWVVWKRTVFDI